MVSPPSAFAVAVPLNFTSARVPVRLERPQRAQCAVRRSLLRAVASGEAATRTDSEAALGTPANGLPDTSQSAIQTINDVEEIVALANEFDLFDFRVEDNGVAVEVSRAGGLGFADGQLMRHPVGELVSGGVGDMEEAGHGAMLRGAEDEEEEIDEAASMNGSVAGRDVEEAVEVVDKSDPDTIYDSDFVVASNRVGFFYSGAKNKPPLVNVGDHVNFNQPVCIIEQLGQQYVYLTEASGTVLKIFVEDGDPVEYDQQVMVIRPD